MSKFATAALILAAALAASGCTRSSNALNINTQPAPQPLPSAPSGSVQTATLDPVATTPQPTPQQLQGEAPQVDTPEPTPEPVEVASLQEPQAAPKPITHESLAGAWNVGSDSAGCRVFLSFTQWSGGYRAGSRQCSSGELSSVSAWDVKNNRVILVDGNGNQVASLTSAGNERYSGTTSTGNPISFSR